MDIHYCEEAHDVKLFFCKPAYCIKLSVSITSNDLLTVATLLDTNTGTILENKNFLVCGWRESIKPNRVSSLWTSNGRVVGIEGIVPLFLRTGNLCLRAWVEIVKSLVVDVQLRISSVTRCMSRIFQTEGESCHEFRGQWQQLQRKPW